MKNYLKIINLDIKFKKPFKISEKDRSKFILNCLNTAHELALNEEVAGVINCAIDKRLLKKEKTESQNI